MNRDNAESVQSLMPAFVKDLRNKWNRGELPFYFVEIAPFNYEGADGTSAARMREVQLQNMKDIPNSGMVSTLDIGHPSLYIPWIKRLSETVWRSGHLQRLTVRKDSDMHHLFINPWRYPITKYIINVEMPNGDCARCGLLSRGLR